MFVIESLRIAVLETPYGESATIGCSEPCQIGQATSYMTVIRFNSCDEI